MSIFITRSLDDRAGNSGKSDRSISNRQEWEVVSDASTIESTFIGCQAALLKLLPSEDGRPSLPQGSREFLQDELGRLRMWAANTGVNQIGHKSLDFRLHDAPHLKEQILATLSLLKATAGDVNDLSKENERYDDVFNQKSSSIETDVKLAFETITSLIGDLHQLSVAACRPASGLSAERVEKALAKLVSGSETQAFEHQTSKSSSGPGFGTSAKLEKKAETKSTSSSWTRAFELLLVILPFLLYGAVHRSNSHSRWKALISRKAKEGQHLEFYWELSGELHLLAVSFQHLLPSLPPLTDAPNMVVLRVDWPKLVSDNLDDVPLLGVNEDLFESCLQGILTSLEALVSSKSFTKTSSNTQARSSMFPKLTTLKSSIEQGESLQALHSRFRFTNNERVRVVALNQIRDDNTKINLFSFSLRTAPSLHDQSSSTGKKAEVSRTRRYPFGLYSKLASHGKDFSENDCQHEARICLWNCCSNHQHLALYDSIDMLISIKDEDQRMSPWQELTVHFSHEGNVQSRPANVQFPVDNIRLPEPPSSILHVKRDVDSQSLYALVKQAKMSKESLQMIFEDGKLRQVTSTGRVLHEETHNEIPLINLLYGSSRPIKMKDQRILAVVLAHTVLHYHGTPWLRENWSKDQITFFERNTLVGPNLTHPYLIVNFDSEERYSNEWDRPLDMHSYPKLLSLGILLLEIHLRQPIESCRVKADLEDGKPNEHPNLTTALRLLEEAEGDLTEGHRKAIHACLKFKFKSADINDSDGKVFRRKMYEQIVSPLEDELYNGWKLRPEDIRLQS